MTDSPRIIDTNESSEDSSIRPKNFNDFIGQDALKKNLRIFIDAAKSRNESPDHILFYGPPGLGKTTLSYIIANELGVQIRSTSGAILTKVGDLAAILTNMQMNEILFIDEIHRLNSAVEELLYSAMEDFVLDLVIGEGPAARNVRINLPQFSLIGATTKLGMLTNPLRDRFGIPMKLDFYSYTELRDVVIRCAKTFNIKLSIDGADEIAKRARGTPRIAIRLFKRIRDFAHFHKVDEISKDLASESLKQLGVDSIGLDEFDYKYIRYIYDYYKGGPVGIETIAAGLNEDRDTIESTIEPYLMQIGFLNRTFRGRELTISCVEHLTKNKDSQLDYL